MKSTGVRCVLAFMVGILGACDRNMNESHHPLKPPTTVEKPVEITSRHGHTRIDPYYWLNNREDTAVVRYLEQENAYTTAMLASTEHFQEQLFQEMKGRIKEEDTSAPYTMDGYLYYERYEAGKEYPIFCRKKEDRSKRETIVADGNELALGHDYFDLDIKASPFHRLVALVTDTVGRRIYTLSIKDMDSGALLQDQIQGTTGEVEWSGDERAIFYVVQDPQTLRAFQVYYHALGTPSSADKLLYEEKDATLSCEIQKSRSKKYILIHSVRTDASKCTVIETAHPFRAPHILCPLQDNVEYNADHLNGKFYVRTNWRATNFRLMEIPDENMDFTMAQELIPEQGGMLLEEFELFERYLVLQESSEGLVNLRILDWKDKTSYSVAFDEAAYVANIGLNPEAGSTHLRFQYQSMATPPSTYEYDMEKHQKKCLKQQEVLEGFDPRSYQIERLMAKGRDGAHIPISIVYRKDVYKKDGKSPCLQYAYGAYGYSMPAYFSSQRLSLLDRGVAFAICHVRGGKEMGGEWYDKGKMMHKKNTFYDFIDCSTFLVADKYCAPDMLFANGGSAGGLLMGAIANMRPEIYKAVVADVPFVDVLTTMMDESIPLTTFEWKEWGNPNSEAEYNYMLTYSPYDNVEKKEYPHMLVTTGLHDSQVQYWEPAKWVAKLRKMKTDHHMLLLKTNMEAGHGGASGRFLSLKEDAFMYAFLFNLIGITQ